MLQKDYLNDEYITQKYFQKQLISSLALLCTIEIFSKFKTLYEYLLPYYFNTFYIFFKL